METRKTIARALLAAWILGASMAADSEMQENTAIQEMAEKIVIFYEGVSQAEIDGFIADCEATGISVKRVPFINGVVLSFSDGITSTDITGHPLIMRVEDDQPMEVLAIQAAGEGGAGEGGAGEGGAGEGGAGEGGAGEGGAGEGGADEPTNSFIEPYFVEPGEDLPWGILYLYDHPYDPSLPMDIFDNKLIPDTVKQTENSAHRKPIKIAVFDTGVDPEHKELKKLIEGGIDLIDSTPGIPLDNNGHGTHVAATLAGMEFGLAYKSTLYAVKLLDNNAVGQVSDLVVAFQWAIDNDIDVVNMSVGFREDNPAVRLAIQKAHETGIIMVAAAGNHSNWEDDGGTGEGGAGEGGAGEGGAGEGGAGEGGAGEGGAGNDGTAGSQYPVMFPAAYPEVIAVAAMDAYLQLAPFSNTGPEVDLLAPGVDVVSANRGGGYGISNGTSAATPHVSGTVALMLALASKEGKAMSLTDVTGILLETAVNGAVNLVGALDAVMALPSE